MVPIMNTKPYIVTLLPMSQTRFTELEVKKKLPLILRMKVQLIMI